MGEPKFTVRFMNNFLVLSFCFVFLMHNFKTSNNFKPKICCENTMSIKIKYLNIKLGPTTVGNKKYYENVVTFCYISKLLFCMTFCCVPRLLFLFSQI